MHQDQTMECGLLPLLGNTLHYMCMIICYIFRNNSISLEKVLNKYAYSVSFRCKYKKSRTNLHCCMSYKLHCKEMTQVNYIGLLLRSKITNSVLIMCVKLHELVVLCFNQEISLWRMYLGMICTLLFEYSSCIMHLYKFQSQSRATTMVIHWNGIIHTMIQR